MRRNGSPRSALVIGLGRFGQAVAAELMALGWEVLGVDIDGAVVQEMAPQLTHAAQADCRELRLVAELGVHDFGFCIIARGSRIEDSIMIALNLQELEARRIVAKAASDQHARILERLGVKEVVFPEQDAGARLARALTASGLVEEMPVVEGWVLEKRRPTPQQVGMTVAQANHLARAQIIGIATEGRLDVNLDSKRVLQAEEVLLLARHTNAR